MKRVAYQNTTNHTVIVGGVSIFPGMTRSVPASAVPSKTKAAPAAEPETPLVERKVSEIKDAIPGLTPEQLDALEADEKAKGDKARSTVLSAIAEQRIANAAAGDDDDNGEGAE